MLNYFFKVISLVSLFSGCYTSSFAYDLREPSDYGVTDIQAWYTSGDGPQKLATGACYGPFLELVNDNQVKLGGFLSPCVMVSYDTVNSRESDSAGEGTALNLFSVLGFSGSVFQEASSGDWKYGVGFSLTDIYAYFINTKPLKPMAVKSPASRTRFQQLSQSELELLRRRFRLLKPSLHQGQ